MKIDLEEDIGTSQEMVERIQLCCEWLAIANTAKIHEMSGYD